MESSLREGKEFEYSCENIQRWLQDMSASVRRDLKISADWDILKQQVQDYEVCARNNYEFPIFLDFLAFYFCI